MILNKIFSVKNNFNNKGKKQALNKNFIKNLLQLLKKKINK